MLVVCPNTLKLNWVRELGRWLTTGATVGVQYAGQEWVGAAVDVVVVNYDILAKFPQAAAAEWDLVVADECHFIKNGKAQRTKALLAIPAKHRLALTGTPILNRPMELVTVLGFCGAIKAFGGDWRFLHRYCGARRNRWGWDFTGATHLEELQARLRETCMVRRLKADVLTELPPKRRQVIEFEVNGARALVEKQNAEWSGREAKLEALAGAVEAARVAEDDEAYRKAVEALREGQGAAFTEMAQLRHEVALAKLPKCVEWIQDALEGGDGKVIVFAHHLDVVQLLREAWPNAAVVTGETPADARQGECDRFQQDASCRVFVGNTAAAEGLTLTAADHVVFVEPQWVPGKLAQMEDRAHRIGQRRSVLVSYLVLEGSLDATMMKTVARKLDVIDRALDKETAWVEEQVDLPPTPTTVQVAGALRGGRIETPRQAALRAEGEAMAPELVAECHAALQRLAAMDPDHAVELNGVGFSAFDGAIGHSLARAASLSAAQAALALRLCRKYRGQLGAGPWGRDGE